MGLVPVHRIDISTLNTRKNFLHNIVIREIRVRGREIMMGEGNKLGPATAKYLSEEGCPISNYL